MGGLKISNALKIVLIVTDSSFIHYWGLTGSMAFGLVTVPPEWLFSDYTDPNIVAWNWSFMPLDLLASPTGLIALRASQLGKIWRDETLISLALTFCAGFTALSFWIFQGSFDAGWWAPNLFLMLWPLFMLPQVLTKP